jgi:hypothetical protein
MAGDFNADGLLDLALGAPLQIAFATKPGGFDFGSSHTPTTDPGQLEDWLIFDRGNNTTAVAVGVYCSPDYRLLTLRSYRLGPELSAQVIEEIGIPAPPTLSNCLSPVFLPPTDLDADGDLDLLSTETYCSSCNLQTFYNDGAGRFTWHPDIVPDGLRNSSPQQLATGQFDSDGRSDLAAYDTYNDQVIVYENIYGFLFAEVATLPGLGFISSVYIADLDADGLDDLVIVDLPLIRSYLRHGPFEFAAPRTVTLSGYEADIALTDMNRDGFADLVTTEQVFLGSGDGTFENPGIPYSSDDYNRVRIGDADGDGDSDLLLAEAVLLWDGGLPLDRRPLPLVADPDPNGPPLVPRLAHIDGDAAPDLVVLAPGGFRMARGRQRFKLADGFRLQLEFPSFFPYEVNYQITAFVATEADSFDLALVNLGTLEPIYSFDGSFWHEGLHPLTSNTHIEPDQPLSFKFHAPAAPQPGYDYYLLYRSHSTGQFHWSWANPTDY